MSLSIGPQGFTPLLPHSPVQKSASINPVPSSEVVDPNMVNEILGQESADHSPKFTVTQLTTDIVTTDIVALDNQEQNLEQLTEKIAELSTAKGETAFNTVIEKMFEKNFAERDIQKGAEDFDVDWSDISKILSNVLNLGKDYENLNNDTDSLNLSQAVTTIPTAATAIFVAANVVNRIVEVVASGKLLNKLQELLESKQKLLETLRQNPQLTENEKQIKEEIHFLEKWIAVQSELFKEQLKHSTVQSTLSTPKIASAIISIFFHQASLASSIVAVVGLGASIITSAIAWRQSSQNLSSYEKWTQVLQNNAKNVETIIARQKRVYDLREQSHLKELKAILSPIQKDIQGVKNLSPELQKKNLNDWLSTLEKLGIKISLENPSIESLELYLNNTENQKELLIMVRQHKEALSVTLRNVLRTFTNKKADIDKGFLSLALHKARALFASSAILATAAIALKVLMIVGVIASSLALTITGYGLLAVVLGLLVVGGIYLYVKKPNIFKTYLRGVQARAFLWNIPLGIQSYKRNLARFKIQRVSEDIKEIGTRILNLKELQTLENKKAFIKQYLPDIALNSIKSTEEADTILEKHKDKLIHVQDRKNTLMLSLTKKIDRLDASVEKLEKRVVVLQNRVQEASWKDFQNQLKVSKQVEPPTLLGTDETGKSIVYDPIKVEEKSQVVGDEAVVLAHYLLHDKSLLEDMETKRLLDHLGIDIELLQKEVTPEVEKQMADILRAFFAMDEEDTTKLIDQQNSLVRHGLRQSTELT